MDNPGRSVRHYMDGSERKFGNADNGSDNAAGRVWPSELTAGRHSTAARERILRARGTSPGRTGNAPGFLWLKTQRLTYDAYLFWLVPVLPE